MTTPVDTRKVGFVSIFGRPNVGKSTFLNALLGKKVSIVSSVPQTTRKKILGIYNDDDSQIIFFDTPGIHNSDKVFNETINSQALRTLSDADVVCYFVDPTRPYGEEEKYLEDIYSRLDKPKFKVFTKSDITHETPEPEEGTVCISSVTKVGFPELLTLIKSSLPTGPLLYPEELYTSQPQDLRIEEVVREKIFLHSRDEIPHSVFVKVDDIQDEPKIMKVLCYIYTETESQKTIVVGKGGAFLTRVGREAREELEKIFGRKIFLSLRVKVYPKWRGDVKLLKNMFE